MSEQNDSSRRFGGVQRLYGAGGMAKLQAAHVCVIGIGGVGSWAAEALARSAIGRITLIDLDNIAESNVNRQLHAIEGEFGKAKVTAMAQRIRAINPACQVIEIEDFITPENAAGMLNQGFDAVLDAIDDAKAKVAIAVYCRQHQLPLVVAGAAGGRLDPTRMKTADLADVAGDRLLAKMRTTLRREHGFPKAAIHAKPDAKTKAKPNSTKSAARFGIACVYSDEQVQQPQAELSSCEADDVKNNSAITGLNCAGYGSSVCVTASFGMASAGLVLAMLTAG